MIRHIRNLSHVQRYCIYDGKAYKIAPQSVDSYDVAIAARFVTENPGHCVIDDGMDKIEEPEYYGPRVWLANVTGNADSTHAHLKEPRVVSRSMQGGQTPDREPKTGAPTWFNHPVSVVQMWPYQRKSYPADKARWMLNRESGTGKPPSIIEARPPTAFDPDDTWELADLVVYASIVDPSIPPPNVVGINDPDSHKASEAMRIEKVTLLKRLFFRVVNPDYKLPTKEEFGILKHDALQITKPRASSVSQPAMAQ